MGWVSERAVLSHARRRRESTAHSLAVVICRKIDRREHEGEYQTNAKVIPHIVY